MAARTLLLSLALLLLLAPTEGNAPRTADSYAGTFEQYAVAADHPLASAAGAEILAAGGTAADAAAATMLALGVANPASSGMGGGGFLLYYRASDQSLSFLDFRERAPLAATPDMYDGVADPMPGRANAASQLGGLASGVPGEPAGVAEMVRRFGRLPLRRIVEPARRLAADGVPASDAVSRMSAAFADHMRQDPVMASWFGEGAELIAPGQVFRQPELARTLRTFGARGHRGIYDGRIAREIVRRNREVGGIMTLEDLRSYEVVTREPLEGNHFGYRWVTAPPPSAGGFTMLASLAVLEGLRPSWRPTDGDEPSADFLHALAESWKGPFMDRERYFGDPDHVQLPLDRLRNEARIAARVNVFHPTLAQPPGDYAFPLEEDEPEVVQPDNAGTSHLCVVDAEGNIAAVTTTVNLPFGARYTAAGMVMNDEMDDFARAVGVTNAFGLVGGAANLPAPGKRPVSTMSPTIVFDGEGPLFCGGASGGSRIVTATQQVAMNALLFGMPLERAIAHGRIHHQAAPNTLRTETFAPSAEATIANLVARGHEHDTMRYVANVQALRFGRNGGPAIEAASDPRKGGRPAGR